ncbi:MAG: SDR family oxidoreductase [Xanthomonadaceae bacterium]|jgi:uncharacterized protein YbjT (DUF2867 family)|nr:SDR family oxidoreductase [Xanthomonadaceae bacterium]
MEDSPLYLPETPACTVLVVGGSGFIGGYIVAALRQHGWRVLRAVRSKGRPLAEDERECNLAQMLTPESWLPLLEGIDAVVNVAGILRETHTQGFDAIHTLAPLALARACIAAGIRKFVQISALGHPEDGEFIASRHRFDQALTKLPLEAVILRPSVVYAASGSYGGSSLLRGMAALPWVMPLPGEGHWNVQPVAAEDLVELVARALESSVRGIYEVVGPEPISLRDYQLAWRRWLRIPGTTVLPVPASWVSLAVKVAEWWGRGPMGETMWRMIRRGNTAAPGTPQRLQEDFGVRVRSLQEVLTATPSLVQDRWQAQLYFLGPTLRFAVVVLWLVSALTGFMTPAFVIEQMVAGSWLEQGMAVPMGRLGGAVDLFLGVWLLTNWRSRAAVTAMMMMLVLYTLVFGTLLPELWLDPLGGMIKNLVILPALGVLWVLSDRR